MVTRPFRPIATCSPSSVDGSYIYSIVPTSNNGLAVISSSDELILLDRASLRQVFSVDSPQVPKGVTCLQPGNNSGNIVSCAGRDGAVVSFDVRSQARVSNVKLDRSVTALACSDTEIALGTELAEQSATISVWDRRQNIMKWQSTENNDDITGLQFHPSHGNYLLSGGVDGLVSIFDTNIGDEDDSLLQVVNHGPIHKAGFLSDKVIFALSHDEQLSIHPVTIEDGDDARHLTGPLSNSEEARTDDVPPVHFHDLRPVLGCDYAIDVLQASDNSFVATGNHTSEPRVDLVRLEITPNPQILRDEVIRLVGAHSEEIVRSVYVDELSGVIYSAGEDGHVTAFRAEQEPQLPSASPKQKKKITKNANSIRYHPY